MNACSEKTKENNSQSVTNNLSEKRSGSKATFHFLDNRLQSVVQRKLQEAAYNGQRAMQLTTFQEMTDYRMQSKLVTQLHAHAYAQDANIHLGPEQEKHLPHEAWHVVQQKQGREKPTTQINGRTNVNDNKALEKEFDKFGRESDSFQMYAIQLNTAPETFAENSIVQLLPQEVSANLFDTENANPDQLRGLTVCVEAVGWILENAGIAFRIGGSLASHLQGAHRLPADIDIEVENGDDIARSIEAFNAGVTWRRNTAAEVTFILIGEQHQDGMFAFVNMRGRETATGLQRNFDVDVTNENNPVFNQDIVSPAERGIGGGAGDLVSAPELVMNYLDRMIKKPEVGAAKADHLQVVSILQNAGFNPANPVHVNELEEAITGLARPDALPHYLHLLEQIINWAIHNA